LSIPNLAGYKFDHHKPNQVSIVAEQSLLLQKLKKKIKTRFPDQFYEYNCKVDGMTDVTGKEKVKIKELGDKSHDP
jgi:hypothetical protein